VLSGRVPEPVVDVHDLGRPLVLTLIVAVLGTGAYQSMLLLFSLLAEVSPEQGLGYGLAGGAVLGVLLGLPALGIALAGVAVLRLIREQRDGRWPRSHHQKKPSQATKGATTTETIP
jgi:hypothetical protein